MDWFVLFVAGLFEVLWSLALKSSRGLTRPIPTLITLSSIAFSMLLLAKATRTLPIGTAYAVWVGIGALGAAIGGALLFDEPLTRARASFLVLLIVSVLGLKVTSPAP